MAVAPLVPKNGAITFNSYVMDFASFSIEASQAVDNVTGYGTNVCTVNNGSGTPDFSFNIAAFMEAHAANTAPSLGGSGTVFTAAGAALVLTLDTGCTESCNMVVGRFSISHARLRGFVPAAISGKNAAEVTEVWAVA